MWAFIRTSYWNGQLTRHEALTSLWMGYGPSSIDRGLRQVAEFTTYKSMSRFLDGVNLPNPKLPL